MTVRQLVRMLTRETWVEIRDNVTHRRVWTGTADTALFEDRVKDWDFSHGHIIYI